MIEFGA